jgi:hypothetical protein|tara:strand:- start:1544 stop:1669 length:126 start_codon:yes stop_codon:yes gene_type:complete
MHRRYYWGYFADASVELRVVPRYHGAMEMNNIDWVLGIEAD